MNLKVAHSAEVMFLLLIEMKRQSKGRHSFSEMNVLIYVQKHSNSVTPLIISPFLRR